MHKLDNPHRHRWPWGFVLGHPGQVVMGAENERARCLYDGQRELRRLGKHRGGGAVCTGHDVAVSGLPWYPPRLAP